MLTWLLMLGVFAGLGGRVLGLDHVHPQDEVSHCCGHDHGGDDDRHSPDCPPGPHEHHTHACCHPSPLAGGEIQRQRLLVPTGVRLCVSWLAALPPDEPVFALDKPPLI